MFLKNAWYVAAWDDEIDDGPVARTIVGDPVVLFRTAAGAAAALEDRCCHRHLPLSLGKVVGDAIQCGYHGLEFDAAGECVRVPGQSQVPPGAQITSYPVVERWHWIWVWMGDPARADKALIPDWWWMDHPDWRMVRGNGGKPLHIKCNYELVTDNLLDLTHLSFVHADTIGADSILDFPVKTEREADRVRMTRLIPDRPPAPLYKMAGGYDGNVDRWQVVEAVLPCYCDVDVGSAEVGSGVIEGDRPQGTAYHALSVATPETETTTNQFYAHPRLFRRDDPEMDEVYRRDFKRVFMEDVVVMEIQQAAMDAAPQAPKVDINVDVPSISFRKLLSDRIAAEAAS